MMSVIKISKIIGVVTYFVYILRIFSGNYDSFLLIVFT